MKFENVKCVECKTREMPLFMRSPPRHNEDVWCKDCMDAKKHID